ncbi:hypothetical protein R1flu_004248 [Riccia fluitans]|uniref:Uncharacterized protein n=1 Tax=Riccia fluitans TaxID=41844 RepID=A0ABD1YSQ3_9MARC
MVLWEITLATAYVLGLRRTYRLALRGQRRLLGNKYPKIREFTERRTRIIFNMALHVYKEIQHRDITVGRNVGNWLLRWLDRARPQANIRGDSGQVCHPGKGSAPARLEVHLFAIDHRRRYYLCKDCQSFMFSKVDPASVNEVCFVRTSLDLCAQHDRWGVCSDSQVFRQLHFAVGCRTVQESKGSICVKTLNI